MKLLLLCLLVFLLSMLLIAEAVDTSTSVPTNSEYAPDRNYGFQIDVNDISNVSNVTFEWSGVNYTNDTAPAVQNSGDLYWFNLTDLATGDYSYKWYVNNTDGIITFTESYSILKNSSFPITLILNGSQSNRSYKHNGVANFTVYLDIPGMTVHLNSNYPGLDTEDHNSVIYRILNLTTQGFFNLIGSWDGNENYTSSSSTYYFDNLAPRYSEETTSPPYSSLYSQNGTYNFRISWFDADLTEVKFESNFTGSKKNYTTSTTPKINNDGNSYWINITDIRARNISYMWFAKDISNMGNNTTKKVYNIYKARALTFYVPFEEVNNGTTTVVTCYSNTGQIDIGDFELRRNSTKIGNTSALSRTDVSTLPVGAYLYICDTEGNHNYSEQSVNKTIVVLPKEGEKPVIKKEFKITHVSSLRINIGESGQGTFNLSSTLDETITDIKVSLTGIDSNWYTIENVPNALLTGGSTIIKINFDIPSNADVKKHYVEIRVTGKAGSATKIATSEMALTVQYEEPVPNTPPYYSSHNVNNSVAGEEVMFSIEVQDDNGLSGFIFSTNNSGTWVNDSWSSLSGTEDYVEVLKDLNPATGLVIGWRVFVNDTDNEWSNSEEYLLTTQEKKEEFNLLIPIIVVVVFAAAVFIIINRLGAQTIKKKVIYYYSKDHTRLFSS
ncbi:MAG: hypothetical protein ABIE55_02440 [Candidatus Aenigmatarchaeota archaeon]